MAITLDDFKPASQQPVNGSASPGPESKPGDPKPSGSTLSESDILKSGEQAKMQGFTMGDYAKSGGGSGGAGQGSGAGSQTNAGAFISGKIALTAIDAVIPALIVFAFSRAGIVVRKSDMQLTPRETDNLTPIVQKCLDSLMINFDNPWVALAVMSIAIYGSKALEHGQKGAAEKRRTTETAKKEQAEKPTNKDKSSKTHTKPPVPPPESPADFTGKDANGNNLHPWGPEDLAAVRNKRKRGEADAIEWLNNNWEKKGGKI